MSWADIENAMQAAVVEASGFPGDRVFWSFQDVSEPELDHIVIHFGGETQIGIDRLRITQDLARPNGQEIEQRVTGVREVPFEFEVFTAATNGDAAARRIAEIIRGSLRLPNIRYRLKRAGLSPFDPQAVNYIPYIPTVRFVGRATCTVRCYVPVLDIVEYVGYIARVRGTVYPRGYVGPSGATGVNFDSANAP